MATPNHPSGTRFAPADLAPALQRLADALAWPLWLLDEQGRPQHANRCAQRLLAAGQPLQLGAHGRLHPAALAHRAEFVQALRAAALGQPQALRWPGQVGGYAATLRPLAPLASGQALLLLSLDAPPALTPDLQGFAQAHGLSAAEQRVLQALADGLSATRAAQQLGLAVSTVRSHVKALRSKTGHATAAALMQTLARLPPRLWLHGDGK